MSKRTNSGSEKDYDPNRRNRQETENEEENSNPPPRQEDETPTTQDQHEHGDTTSENSVIVHEDSTSLTPASPPNNQLQHQDPPLAKPEEDTKKPKNPLPKSQMKKIQEIVEKHQQSRRKLLEEGKSVAISDTSFSTTKQSLSQDQDLGSEEPAETRTSIERNAPRSRQESDNASLDSISEDGQYLQLQDTNIRKTNTMDFDSSDLLVLDSKIPHFNIPIPPAGTVKGPNITVRELARSSLLSLKENYNTLRAQIDLAETILPRKSRNDEHRYKLRSQRDQLKAVYDKAVAQRDKIQDIQDIQNSLKPTLQLPKFRGGDISQATKNIKSIVDFIGESNKHKDQQTRLVETWNKIVQYCNRIEQGDNCFKFYLLGLLYGDHHDHYVEIQDEPIEYIADSMAKRFITESKFQASMTDLQNFKREPGENIRIAMGRLRSLLDKVAVIYPISERNTRRRVNMESTLRAIISKDALSILDKKRLEARQEGLCMDLAEMIEIIYNYEAQFGIPNDELTSSIMVHNTTTQKNEEKSEIAKLTDTMMKFMIAMTENQERRSRATERGYRKPRSDTPHSVNAITPEQIRANYPNISVSRPRTRSNTPQRSLDRDTRLHTPLKQQPSRRNSWSEGRSRSGSSPRPSDYALQRAQKNLAGTNTSIIRTDDVDMRDASKGHSRPHTPSRSNVQFHPDMPRYTSDNGHSPRRRDDRSYDDRRSRRDDRSYDDRRSSGRRLNDQYQQRSQSKSPGRNYPYETVDPRKFWNEYRKPSAPELDQYKVFWKDHPYYRRGPSPYRGRQTPFIAANDNAKVTVGTTCDTCKRPIYGPQAHCIRTDCVNNHPQENSSSIDN